MRALAFRLASASPSDVSGVRELFDTGQLRAEDVVAILGKTEGNGGRNDFTRELAVSSFARFLAERLGVGPAEVEDRIVLSFSGGTEGVACPHTVVFARSGEPVAQRHDQKRLAIAVGATRRFAPEEIGRMPQVLETARVVRELASTLRLDELADIHLVQMKGAIPDVSFEAREAARRRGEALRCDMKYSRAASALGTALATGELAEQELSDDAVCSRWDLYSSVASVSAKPGLGRTEVMLLANSPYWDGDLAIQHGVMRDILDVEAIRATLSQLGIDSSGSVPFDQAARIVGTFAKSEADPRGTIRGRRHIMLDDDDVSDTRWSRCALAAVLASVMGDTAVYVSTRAEHMGPPGGGPVAIVAKMAPGEGA